MQAKIADHDKTISELKGDVKWLKIEMRVFCYLFLCICGSAHPDLRPIIHELLKGAEAAMAATLHP
jgi:hypothetical protein